jgi:glutathione S-transferase
MQLFYSAASPYARKARVILIEKNLQDRVQLHHCMPLENPPSLLQANPLGKVPALILDNGQALYDSPVICEYLDALDPSTPLIPPHGDEHWTVLRAHALADGLLDTAVAQIYESRRPDNERSPSVVARWQTQMLRAVDEMEVQLPLLPQNLNLGHIAFACALGYLDLRFVHLDWRSTHPALARWFNDFSLRPSMRETRAN